MGPEFRIILSPEAAADLQLLHDFISRDSPQNAAKIVGRILDAIDGLRVFPHRNVLAHQSKKVAHYVRSLPVKPYIVYFRVLEQQEAVRVLSVRHGARRPPKRFD